MFKKIISLALAIIMILSVAVIAASAAETDVAENAADVPAEVGADAEAETGAGNTISFDTSSTGWNGFSWVAFHIWPVGNEDFEAYAWGSKKQRGTDSGNGVWTYDLDKQGFNLVAGHQYAVIFYTDTAQQTYNLLFGAECIGKTAACNGTTYENPEDSEKTALAAFWGGGIDSSVYGPELKISSIGTVVGTCCAASTTPLKMFEEFLTSTLGNARTFSGKNDQTLIDDTCKALGIGKKDCKDTIASTGVTVEWDESKSSLADESDDSANQSGGGNGGSNGGGSNTSGGGSGTANNNTTKTGQETTVLFIMLGVMVAAAGVIFFVRKRERA